MTKVIVVGSINMDIVVKADQLPKVAETVVGESIHFNAGGKGANTAISLCII